MLERLRAKVAQRKAAAEYPDDLPERMAAHFDALLRRRGNLTEPSTDHRIDEQLARVRESGRFGLERIPTSSRVPGGGVVHRAVRRAVGRDLRGVVQQIRTSHDALRGALDVVVARVRELENGTTVELSGLDQRLGESTVALRGLEARAGAAAADAALQRARVGALEGGAAALRDHLDAAVGEARGALDRAHAATERLAADVEDRFARLQARVERLERVERDRGFHPWFDLDAFEARFRGTRADILDRYADLVPFLLGCAPVLDLGCGRGELLELLAKHGVEAYGVEIDAELVAEVQERGLRALLGDGLAHLESLPDDSLGGLVLLQVIEHLTPQQQLDLLALAHRKLRADGRLLIETVNPTSLYVYTHAMYLDPTHTQPVHPQYLQFLADELDFAEVGIQWRSPVPEPALPLGGERARGDLAEAGPGDGAADGPLERALRTLDPLLFGYQDYLLVATK